MKLVNKKTRKAINKAVKKAVKKHGQTLAAGVIGGLASTLATLAKTDAPGAAGRSNLSMLAENIKEALTEQQSGKHGRKKAAHETQMNHNLTAAPS